MKMWKRAVGPGWEDYCLVVSLLILKEKWGEKKGWGGGKQEGLTVVKIQHPGPKNC